MRLIVSQQDEHLSPSHTDCQLSSTQTCADSIYVTDDVRVLEQGTYWEPIAKEGHYARLVQAQKLRGSEEDEEVVGGDSSQENELGTN